MKPTIKNGEHSWSTSCTDNDNYHDDELIMREGAVEQLSQRLGWGEGKGNGNIDAGKVTLVQNGIHSVTKTKL